MEQDRLTRNMLALDAGLRSIAAAHRPHVSFDYEDPETFGAGHFVLYPFGHSRFRFAIDEQYSGTDWSDPDRVPTSWAWRAQADRRQTDGSWRWVTDAEGEVASDDYARLLALANTWAERVNARETRRETIRRMVPSTRVPGPPASPTRGL